MSLLRWATFAIPTVCRELLYIARGWVLLGGAMTVGICHPSLLVMYFPRVSVWAVSHRYRRAVRACMQRRAGARYYQKRNISFRLRE